MATYFPLLKAHLLVFVDISPMFGPTAVATFVVVFVFWHISLERNGLVQIRIHSISSSLYLIFSFTFVNASIANPFMAVEYLDTQIARVQLDNGRWVYGGARMAERSGFAADPRGGPLIRVCFF